MLHFGHPEAALQKPGGGRAGRRLPTMFACCVPPRRPGLRKLRLGLGTTSFLRIAAFFTFMPHNPLDILYIRLAMFLIYGTVFTVAVSGNILVVYVVTNNRRMHTVTNIFICNLAISDLLVNFTSLWLTPTYQYIGQWIWGYWLCHGLPLIQGTSIFLSTLTLMAIAVDRYFVIVRNGRMGTSDRCGIKKCICVISLIWLISLGLVMPYAVSMKLSYVPEPCNFRTCIEDWQGSATMKEIYGISVMVMQFIIPFTIIGLSYSKIWQFLLKHEEESTARGLIARDTARKKRLLRMLVTMVLIFAICWFPFNLLGMLRDYGMLSWMPWPQFMFLVFHLIAMTATCWNPILYAWMNDSFRKEFMLAIPCLRRGQLGRQTRIESKSVGLLESPTFQRQLSVGEKNRSIWAEIKSAICCRQLPPNDVRLNNVLPDDTLKETIVSDVDVHGRNKTHETCQL